MGNGVGVAVGVGVGAGVGVGVGVGVGGAHAARLTASPREMMTRAARFMRLLCETRLPEPLTLWGVVGLE